MNQYYSPAKVFVLTGFFGSGKTTLVKQIAKSTLANQIAIIQNEFSKEMGIEAQTMVDGDGKELGNFLEMPSGCMCCVVRDGTVLFLQKLLKLKPEIRYIVVESHGMAEVGQVIQKFWVDDELELGITYAKTICVIDAFNYLDSFKDYKEIFMHQVIVADLILLNKTDLLDSNPDKQKILGSIYEDLGTINPLSQYLETNFCNFDIVKELFNCSPLEKSNSKLEVLGRLDSQSDLCLKDAHLVEKYGVESLIINFSYKISKDALDKSIGQLIWDMSEKLSFSIIRYKGVIIDNLDIPYQIQGLYDTYEFTKMPYSYVGGSKILLIGKGLLQHEASITKLLHEGMLTEH